MQEDSKWALNSFDYSNSLRIARKYRKLINKSAKNKLFFVTWPRKDDSSWYKGDRGAFFKNYNYMRQVNNKKSAILANIYNAKMVKISDYWHYIKVNHPEINLYDGDNNNPNILGSYLNALIFYKIFNDNINLEEIKYFPANISKKKANLLKSIANKDFRKL